MAWIKQIISFLIGHYTSRMLKRKATLIYLKVLQITRKSVLAAFLVYFILQLMVLGFIGTVIVGIWILPIEEIERLYILLGVFGAMFLLPAIGLCFAFSERLWFEASGAKKLMDPQSE